MNRRDFVLASAVAAQGVAQEQRVGTAMIGTGNRGSYVLKGVLEQPNAKVAVLCDIKPDRLDSAASAAARDNPATTREWRQAIERKDVAAVFIATPPHLHAEMAIAALKAGKHVYCEKPIGVNAEQVRDLVKAAKASSKVFVVGQQMRSMRGLQEAVAKLRQGVIGDVIGVKAHRLNNGDLDHNGPSADWYFDVSKSGGYLIEMSVHNLDACNWAVGAHPARAVGFGNILRYKNDPPGRTIFDCGNIVYEYPSGAELVYSLNTYLPRGFPGGSQGIHVYGTKGAVDLLGGANLYLHAGDGKPAPLAPKYDEAPHAHVTAFYDAITKGGKNPADISVGAAGALTAILGHEAMVRRKPVEWKDLGVEV